MNPESAFSHIYPPRQKKSKTCFDLYLDKFSPEKSKNKTEAKQLRIDETQPVSQNIRRW